MHVTHATRHPVRRFFTWFLFVGALALTCASGVFVGNWYVKHDAATYADDVDPADRQGWTFLGRCPEFGRACRGEVWSHGPFFLITCEHRVIFAPPHKHDDTGRDAGY